MFCLLMWVIWLGTLLLQMSGEANKEFMEQLRMQELYGQRKDDGSDPNTYTDPEDGTMYDWDHEKKAWFPKVWLFFFFLM